MDKKKLVKWFSIFMVITLSLVTLITYIDKEDDSRQRAQAGSYENERLTASLSNKEQSSDDTTIEDTEEDTTGKINSEQQTTTSSETETTEPGTINVEKETAYGHDGHSLRTNEGARVYDDIDPNKPMVALTFDDGPNKSSTTRILDALEKYNARATFFVVGYKVADNADLIKREYNLGCEIGNHTYSHVELTTIDSDQVAGEIKNTEKAIRKITGQKRVVIRPPYGSVNDEILQEIKYPIILWSIDTEDWETRNAKQTIKNVMNQVKDGSVILMHDSYDESADAAEVIIQKLVKQGYQLVTVSELGYYKFGGLASGIKYGGMYGDD